MSEEFKPTTDISDLSDKKLDELLPKKNEEESYGTVEKISPADDIDADFEEVRENIKGITEKGGDLLDDMIALARASDHPRAFEVAGTLMKNLLDANKDLLDIHERKAKIKGNKPESETTNNVQNNTVFVGSTKELQEMLKKKTEDDS